MWDSINVYLWYDSLYKSQVSKRKLQMRETIIMQKTLDDINKFPHIEICTNERVSG